MKRTSWLIGILLSVTVVACGTDAPTQPSLSAPFVQSPVPGEIISDNPPTLTVSNAQGGEGEPTYAFQVSTDSSFGTLLASVEGVGQGLGVSTSWQVPAPLEGGQTEGGAEKYYWRARASASGETGPWSTTASFGIQTGFFRPGGGELIVYDPLTAGGSVGVVSGGTFEPRGWRTTDATSYIRYQVPTITSGYAEFDVTNLREPNPHSDKRMLMIMWDPSRGSYTTNPYRVHLQKLDRRTVDFGHVRLRWISAGQERNIYHDRTSWDPNHVYQFRMEWGKFPNIDTQWIRVLLNGEEILTANYDNLYQPSPHFIELGGAPRNETLEQAVFSNVSIGRR